jgi:uncharacterized protein YutE (UPF0331/DUF86 family)
VTDRHLIARKLAHIEANVQELRDLGHPAEIQDDVRERRFVERTLELAIQAMLDVAANILADEPPGEPGTHRGLIEPLEQSGWVQADLAAQLRVWVKLRNTLVYDYESVDLELVERVATEHLNGFLAFVRSIQQQLMPS